MTTHRTRILALAAAAAVAMAGPAWAQGETAAGEPAKAKPPGVTYVLDKGVTSNRLATARMWTELHDAAQALRVEAAAENWDAALKRAREVRTRIDRLTASNVVDRNARMLIAELRPFARDIEERIVQGRGRGVLRGVDTLIAHVGRTQNELLAAGHMERMGGGAGAWRLPKMPEVKIYPPGTGPEAIPPAKAPTDENLEREGPTEDPNRNLSPGNERNQMDEWREPID